MEAPSMCSSRRPKSRCMYAFTLLVALLMTSQQADAHGRLLQPPSRSTMWRFGFKTPPNYNDHELFCGGLSRLQYNRGRCGICGDPWDMRPPRPNEAGGIYANGIIVQRYKMNQMIQTEVELTANHRGFFEFKICPTNNPKINPTQNCFNQNVLRLANGKGTRFYVNKRSPNQRYKVRLLLPKGMRCSFCTIQWNYVAGNNWGHCPNGRVGMGCGPQETFRACADVAIGGRFAPRMVTGDEFSNFSMPMSLEELEENTDSDVTNSAAITTGDVIGLAFTLVLHFLFVRYFL